MNEHESYEQAGKNRGADGTKQVLVRDFFGDPGEPLCRLKAESGSSPSLSAALFLAVPGEEIDLDHIVCAPGSVLTEGESDREHEERRDLVGHKRLQRTISHRHRGERVRKLHRFAQPLSK